MSWDLSNSLASWIDGDAGTSGDQAQFNINATDTNAYTVSSLKHIKTVDLGSKHRGLMMKWFRASEYGDTNGYYWVPVEFTDPSSYSATSIEVDNKLYIDFNANDDSFKSKSGLEIELEYDNGTYYVYQTTYNAPTSDTYYIILRSSTDLLTFTEPTEYLLKDYRDPQVFNLDGSIYMLAYSTIDEGWYLIPGTSYANFDASKRTKVSIGRLMYGLGGWDDTPLLTTFTNKEPLISGVEVINSKVYVFYLAGGFGQHSGDANASNGVPYSSARGIGVIELKISK